MRKQLGCFIPSLNTNTIQQQSAVDYVLLQKDVDAVGQWSSYYELPQVHPHKMQSDGLL